MKLIIVVDCQNDFITGPLGTPEAVVARDNLIEYLKSNSDDNHCVIYTQDTHYGDYLATQEGKKLPIKHCQYGTTGWQIDKKLTSIVDLDTAIVTIKNSFGSLALADDIAHVGRTAGPIDEIILCGIATNICVISNALRLKADFPEIPMKVIANCCAGTTPEDHKAALQVMRSCQIEVENE